MEEKAKRDEERKQRMIESERQQKVETAKRDDCTVRRVFMDFQWKFVENIWKP